MTIEEAKKIAFQLKKIRDIKKTKKGEWISALCLYLEGYTDAVLNKEEN